MDMNGNTPGIKPSYSNGFTPGNLPNVDRSPKIVDVDATSTGEVLISDALDAAEKLVLMGSKSVTITRSDLAAEGEELPSVELNYTLNGEELFGSDMTYTSDGENTSSPDQNYLQRSNDNELKLNIKSTNATGGTITVEMSPLIK